MMIIKNVAFRRAVFLKFIFPYRRETILQKEVREGRDVAR